MASSLKFALITETSMRASWATSLVIFGPGTSTRHTGASPRDRSSSLITSFRRVSDGTSAPRRSTACAISALVSPDDIPGDCARTVPPAPRLGT